MRHTQVPASSRRRMAARIIATGGVPVAFAPWPYIRHMNPNSVRSFANGSTSTPSTRTVGEPRNRCATASSESTIAVRTIVAVQRSSLNARRIRCSVSSTLGQPSNASSSMFKLVLDDCARRELLAVQRHHRLRESKHLGDSLIRNRVVNVPAIVSGRHETAPTQARQMVRNAALRDRKLIDEFAH